MSLPASPAVPLLPDTADPLTLNLIDRLMALRIEARQILLETRLAIEAGNRILRESRALLADRPYSPDPPDDHHRPD
jgi:hypothetical protein